MSELCKPCDGLRKIGLAAAFPSNITLGKGRVAPRCIPEGKAREGAALAVRQCRVVAAHGRRSGPKQEAQRLTESPAPTAARRRVPWRGRPRVADPKGKVIRLRCTEEDRAFIAQSAAEAGLSTGAYLRTLALGRAGPRAVKRPHAEREQLARILGEIGKLGSNHNQIASKARRALWSWRRCATILRRCAPK